MEHPSSPALIHHHSRFVDLNMLLPLSLLGRVKTSGRALAYFSFSSPLLFDKLLCYFILPFFTFPFLPYLS